MWRSKTNKNWLKICVTCANGWICCNSYIVLDKYCRIYSNKLQSHERKLWFKSVFLMIKYFMIDFVLFEKKTCRLLKNYSEEKNNIQREKKTKKNSSNLETTKAKAVWIIRMCLMSSYTKFHWSHIDSGMREWDVFYSLRNLIQNK